jgi:RimJ/RimL family protein N-acetyltransferase
VGCDDLGVDLVIRPFQVEDAPLLHDAILDSLDHLRPWMPWIAGEPLTLEQRVAWVRTAAESVGVFLGGLVVGGTGLHDRVAPDGREIGYWVRDGWTGRGIATEVARIMTERAFAIDGVDHVVIHHDKANRPSGRVPAKLGFTLVREVPDEIAAPGEIGISCEWRLDKS